MRPLEAGPEMGWKLHLVVDSPNDAMARHRRLRGEHANLTKAVGDGDAGVAQQHLKACLEAIHELNDERARGAWSSSGWSADEDENWLAHVAARNGSHHQSHGVAKIHLRPGSGSGVMHWALPPQTINFANQRAAFSARLEGQGVLAPLGAVIASLAGRLPI